MGFRKSAPNCGGLKKPGGVPGVGNGCFSIILKRIIGRKAFKERESKRKKEGAGGSPMLKRRLVSRS